jgi:2-methylcitrate dehydratase PrpD
MTILEDWGVWLAQCDGGAIGSSERDRLERALVDTLCASLGSFQTDDSALLAKAGRVSRAPLFGGTAIDRAAFAVGATRSSEIDDIHMRSCTTPGALVVPTALALAPLAKADAETTAAAIAAGYGVTMRFGLSVEGPKILYRGIWPTYLALPLATAAVSARLLKLDATATANALAIALAAMAGRPGQHRERSARWLLVALSARTGMAAALAAADGMVGDLAMLDGDFMQRAHGIAFDDRAFDRRNSPVAMLAEISIKPWCAAKQTVAAITGFRDILAGGVQIESITAIAVATPPAYSRMIAPRGPGAGHTSRIVAIDYQLALAALKPEGLDDVRRPDESTDLEFAALMKKVSLEEDAGLTGDYPAHWPARVTVTTRDGKSTTVDTVAAEGDPDRPLSADAARRKAARLAGRALGQGEGEALVGLAERALADDAALAALSERYGDAIEAALGRGGGK